MDAPNGAPGSSSISLLAATASVALDLSSDAAPLLVPRVATEWALVFPVCPCFDLKDCLRLPPEIQDLRLGVLNLGRVQLAEGIEKTAKVVV